MNAVTLEINFVEDVQARVPSLTPSQAWKVLSHYKRLSLLRRSGSTLVVALPIYWDRAVIRRHAN